MLILQIIWAYFKKYWFIGVAVVGCIFFIIVKMRADAQITKLLKELQNNDVKHQEELKQIQEAHDKENIDHDAHLKQLEVTLADVERQYESAKASLDDEKRAEVKKIIEKYNDNPDELAKRLSEATGIPVVISNK